jgi:hypothetical protein
MASSFWDPHLFNMDPDLDPAQNLKSDPDLDPRCQSNSDPYGPVDPGLARTKLLCYLVQI